MRCGGDNKQAETEFEETCDILVLGIGSLCRWKWPDIEGLHDFEGPIVHSAGWNFGGSHWEEDVKDWGDKKVVVIGGGASAVEALEFVAAEKAKHTSVLARVSLVMFLGIIY